MGPMRRGRVCYLTHQQVSCIRTKLFRITHYPFFLSFFRFNLFFHAFFFSLSPNHFHQQKHCYGFHQNSTHSTQSENIFLLFQPYLCPFPTHFSYVTSLLATIFFFMLLLTHYYTLFQKPNQILLIPQLYRITLSYLTTISSKTHNFLKS